MNAITYWLTEHFSLYVGSNMTEDVGDFPLIDVGVDWWLPNYYGFHVALLGITANLSFWPNGKYDETDGAGA